MKKKKWNKPVLQNISILQTAGSNAKGPNESSNKPNAKKS